MRNLRTSALVHCRSITVFFIRCPLSTLRALMFAVIWCITFLLLCGAIFCVFKRTDILRLPDRCKWQVLHNQWLSLVYNAVQWRCFCEQWRRHALVRSIMNIFYLMCRVAQKPDCFFKFVIFLYGNIERHYMYIISNCLVPHLE